MVKLKLRKAKPLAAVPSLMHREAQTSTHAAWLFTHAAGGTRELGVGWIPAPGLTGGETLGNVISSFCVFISHNFCDRRRSCVLKI